VMENYWRSVRDAGLEPIDLYEPGATLKGCAGLVLTGGRDIDPARYGAAPHLVTDEPNQQRDDLEFALLETALRADMPVLAICRGHQLLNVALGGSLHQHIEGDAHRSIEDEASSSRWHDVALVPDTRLARWLGAEKVRVNSRHHQAVTPATLAEGLRVCGTSDDGLIEAVESERHGWVIGVQWHPERLEAGEDAFGKASRRLFEAFAKAVGGRRLAQTG
jgi:putative glutamine amidotransferase